MTSERSSRTTSRFFAAVNGSSVTPQTRRVTRSSIAQFEYPPAVSNKTRDDGGDVGQGDLTLGSDIEDAITRTRKRRKVTSTTSSTPARRSSKPMMATAGTETSTTTTSSKPATSRRKPARKTKDPQTGETTGVKPPSDWQEMYEAVRVMRTSPGGAAAGAAVDTMGCERLADPAASPRDRRFHTLVALMMSSQTKDTVNAVAMQRLKTELPPCREGAPAGLNLENMLAVDPDKLNELIWAVGFHNNKTKYLKRTAIILRDKYNSDIPDTIEGLTFLPGVGPKMAHLCLSAAWGRTEGIGVDVHVHRITNLWGWHSTRTPEETRRALESWLPRDRWREINGLLVGLGQTICLPVGRRCGDCTLGLDRLCRAADRAKVAQGRRMKKEKLEETAAAEVEMRNGEDHKVKVEVVEEETKEPVADEVVNETVKVEEGGAEGVDGVRGKATATPEKAEMGG